MQKITTFITYEDRAEEAVNFYVSLFNDARILGMSHYPNEVPGLGGKMMSARFELAGQQFMAMNGGPHFTFSDGFSLFVTCQGQDEVDHLWEALCADGGAPGQCGWLKDKFGVSWQIIPTALGELMGAPDAKKAHAVTQAMLQMTKIDIAALQLAYDEA